MSSPPSRHDPAAAAAEKEQNQNPQQQPKSPPTLRRSVRERVLHKLPLYTGPYPVGYVELELSARDPRPFSHIKRNHQHALRLDTVLFAVYYPAVHELTSTSTRSVSRASWLPRPRVSTCKGYAKFLNIPHLPVTAYIALTSMFTKMPAFRNAALAAHLPDVSGGPAGSHGDGHPKFPCVVFSHGLGGSRTSYSSICGELASYGVVVVAIEHRDGSGARTYVTTPDYGEPATCGDRIGSKDHGNGYYTVDYIFPKDNAQDTSPHNTLGVDTELRAAQTEMRLAEIEEAFYVVDMINRGAGEEIAGRNLRPRGAAKTSCGPSDKINWKDWKGRLEMANVTVMGHSFGGVTTVQALRLNDRFSWVGQGVLLDVWGLATIDSTSRVTKPLLSIGSEAFMHWRENFDIVKDICQEAQGEGAPSWMLSIRGSTHLSQTDLAVLYPNAMSLLMKSVINPKRALNLTVTTTLEFLEIVLPQDGPEVKHDWMHEGLLEQSESQTNISMELRPDERWVAARLKIEHEFSLRMRHWFRWRRRKAPGNDSETGGQQQLVGLKSWGDEGEVWVHLTPDQPHRSGPRAVPAGESPAGVESEGGARLSTTGLSARSEA